MATFILIRIRLIRLLGAARSQDSILFKYSWPGLYCSFISLLPFKERQWRKFKSLLFSWLAPYLWHKCTLTTHKHMHLHTVASHLHPHTLRFWMITLEGQEWGHLRGDGGAVSVASIWWPSFCHLPLQYSYSEGHLHWYHEIWMLCGRKRSNRPFTATWEWIERETEEAYFKKWLKRKISSVFASPSFFIFLICHLNSNNWWGLIGKCVRGMWSTVKLTGKYVRCMRVCVRERNKRKCPRETRGDWFHLHYSV